MYDTTETNHPTPRLWNPNAAANWSLLFSPIFGAWIHAKNWRELGHPDKAKQSMVWVYIGLVFLVGVFFLPDKVGGSPGLVFILAWYFTMGKKQMDYLENRGIEYEPKSWGKPILLGFGGLVSYFMIIIVIVFMTDFKMTEVYEESSVDLVTQILQEQFGDTATCTKVTIVEEVSDGVYRATATLSNGKELEIKIESKGDQILVSISNPSNPVELFPSGLPGE